MDKEDVVGSCFETGVGVQVMDEVEMLEADADADADADTDDPDTEELLFFDELRKAFRNMVVVVDSVDVVDIVVDVIQAAVPLCRCSAEKDSVVLRDPLPVVCS